MPVQQTIYYRDGSSASMDAIDARKALAEHPEEWKSNPWPEAEVFAYRDTLKTAVAATPAPSEDLIPRSEVQKLVDDAVKTAVAAALAQAPAPSAAGDVDTPDFKAPFEARDKGRGWWAVYDAAGTEVGKSIREDEGKAFNSKTDEEKAEFVKAHLAIS